MRVSILQVRLVCREVSKGFDCCEMSVCPNAYAPKTDHRYVVVEQRRAYNSHGFHYYHCKACGHEKPLNDACVIDMEHQHDYRNYRGCPNGFYILRCTHFGCESFLRVFNPESQDYIKNGKHYLED